MALLFWAAFVLAPFSVGMARAQGVAHPIATGCRRIVTTKAQSLGRVSHPPLTLPSPRGRGFWRLLRAVRVALVVIGWVRAKSGSRAIGQDAHEFNAGAEGVPSPLGEGRVRGGVAALRFGLRCIALGCPSGGAGGSRKSAIRAMAPRLSRSWPRLRPHLSPSFRDILVLAPSNVSECLRLGFTIALSPRLTLHCFVMETPIEQVARSMKVQDITEHSSKIMSILPPVQPNESRSALPGRATPEGKLDLGDHHRIHLYDDDAGPHRRNSPPSARSFARQPDSSQV